jgi:hypothetical protein
MSNLNVEILNGDKFLSLFYDISFFSLNPPISKEREP